MYVWIFKHLPGPLWFRIVESVLLIVAAGYALFTWGYPLIEETFFDGLSA